MQENVSVNMPEIIFLNITEEEIVLRPGERRPPVAINIDATDRTTWIGGERDTSYIVALRNETRA